MTDNQASLPDAIRSFVDATNAGDTDRFLAAFTPDAYLNDWGREFHGRDGVARWNQTDNIGKQSSFTVHGVTPGAGPGQYDVDMTVRGNGYNGRGILKFTIADGLIGRLVIS
jgi:hypothetical protein